MKAIISGALATFVALCLSAGVQANTLTPSLLKVPATAVSDTGKMAKDKMKMDKKKMDKMGKMDKKMNKKKMDKMGKDSTGKM